MRLVKLTRADLHEARMLRREGWTLARLAKRYGVAPGTLSQRLKSPNAAGSKVDFQSMYRKVIAR